jgi:hypothetical protein
MFVFTLVVIGLLLLLFRSTRLSGIAGLTLLSLVYPLLFLALLFIGCAIFYFIYFTRRDHHAFTIPKLPNRRR